MQGGIGTVNAAGTVASDGGDSLGTISIFSSAEGAEGVLEEERFVAVASDVTEIK